MAEVNWVAEAYLSPDYPCPACGTVTSWYAATSACDCRKYSHLPDGRLIPLLLETPINGDSHD